MTWAGGTAWAQLISLAGGRRGDHVEGGQSTQGRGAGILFQKGGRVLSRRGKESGSREAKGTRGQFHDKVMARGGVWN